MIASVSAASPMFAGLPKVGAVTTPPPAQRIATGSSEMPITVMTDPVTTGGKKCSSRLNTPESRNPMIPATRMAPKMNCSPRDAAAGVLADGEHRGDGGERGALHQRQPGADPPDAERLQQRGEPGHEQRGGEQVGEVGEGQAERAADDQRHRDHAGVHAHHVLQAVEEQLPDGQHLVDRVAVDRRGADEVRAIAGVTSPGRGRTRPAPGFGASSRRTVPSM